MADRSVLVRLRADISDFQRKFAAAGGTANVLVRDLETADSRMSNLVQTTLALAPAFVPISAAAVPALAGLATQATAGAAGLAVFVSAFNGVGDALKAVSEYRLAPTAENFAKMQEAMAGLPASAREMVTYLDTQVIPVLDRLQDRAADGVLPGVQDGLEALRTRVPELRSIVGQLADAGGQLASEAGVDVASKDWRDFLQMLDSEAAPTLLSTGRTVGNVLQGLADGLVAFTPLSRDFVSGLEDWSEGFADAAGNAESSERFLAFLDYARDVTPDALDTIGAIGGALVAVTEAAAPVGRVALPVIEGLADGLTLVANSPAGPVLIGAAAGISAVSRAVALFKAANGSAMINMLQGTRTQGAAAGKAATAAGGGMAYLMTQVDQVKARVMLGAAALGTLALASTDLDDKMGLSNTAMMATMGLVAGPWGAAVGGAIGATMDFAAVNDDLESAVKRADLALDSMSRDGLRSSRDELRALLQENRAAGQDDMFWDIDASVADNLGFLKAKLNDFTGDTDNVRERLRMVRTEMSDAGGAAELLSGPLGQTGESFERAAMGADDFRASLAAVNRVLEGRANMRDYESALDEFTASVKENGRSLDISTDAGRANQAALDSIATTALTVAENMRGANRVDFLQRARGSFISAAQDLRLTRSEAEKLADKLGLLDKQRARPKVDVDNGPARKKLDQTRDWITQWGKERESATADADNRPARKKLDMSRDWINDWARERGTATADVNEKPAEVGIDTAMRGLSSYDRMLATATLNANYSPAMSAIAQLRASLANIPDEVVYIRAVRTGPGGQKAGYDGGMDGGMPFGGRIRRAAAGEMVPDTGLGYADRHLYMLADREHIMTNRRGEADRNRWELEAANRGAKLAVVGHGAARQPLQHSQGSGSVGVVERVIIRETLPRTIVLDAGEIGRFAVDTATGAVEDYDDRQSSRRKTSWREPTHG